MCVARNVLERPEAFETLPHEPMKISHIFVHLGTYHEYVWETFESHGFSLFPGGSRASMALCVRRMEGKYF